MSTGAEKCEFVTTASRNKLFRPSAAHDSLVFWAGRIEAKRLTMVLIVGWPAFGAESRRRLIAWRRPTWRVWDGFVSTFTHRRSIRQWPAAPVCRYEAPRAKKQVGSCRNEALFRAQSRGGRKRMSPVLVVTSVTSAPVGTPLHARGLAAPTECVALPTSHQSAALCPA